MRTRLNCLCITLCLFAAVPLYAETRLIFPRIVFQRNYFSGLAVANPTLGWATIRLTAYDAGGALLAGTGITNPATRVLDPGEQFVATAAEIFTPPASMADGASPTRVWVEVTSPEDGLTGFFLDGDGSLTFMDGSDVGAPGIELILPVVRNNPGASTEISVINPGNSQADIRAEFLRANGAPAVPARERTIAARGALFGPLPEVFPVSYADVVALRITATAPVTCFGYLLSFHTLITVPARSTALAAKTLYFPQLAEGGSWTTSIGVVNTSSTSEAVTFTAHGVDGRLIATPGVTNPTTRIIAGGEILHASARQLFGLPASPLQQGWIRVEAVRPALYGYVEYGEGTNRALVSAQLEACTKAVFSYVALRSRYYTGLAVLNPSSLATNVEIVYLSTKGDRLAKLQTVLRPGERQARVLGVPGEWFANIPAMGIHDGALFVKSDNPIIATQLFGTTDYTLLSNVPPQKVTTEYDPASYMTTVKVDPPLAVVETGKSQKFTCSGMAGPGWYVDDVAGGSSSMGTVAADGTYRAPSKAPAKRSIAVSARNAAGDQSGGASIHVLEREEFIHGLATVTSVAHFENARRFFIAEQQVITAPVPPERQEATTNAQILEQKQDGTRTQFLPFDGDSLGKILPYVDAYNRNWLLAAGTISGNIYRIDLDTRQQKTIAQGLNKPNSMVLDGAGDLLVALEDAVEIIPRASLDAAPDGALRAQLPRRTVDIRSPRGVAVDRCSGAVYVTTADGTLWEFIGNKRRDVLAQQPRLNNPNEIFVLYVEGESRCLDALALLICESDGLSIVFPSESRRYRFVGEAAGGGSEEFPRDLQYFPAGNLFSPRREAAIVIAENNRITAVAVEGLYSQEDPISNEERGFTAGDFPHPDPAGDTFASESPSLGYKVPDLVSVDVADMAGTKLITASFAGPVVKAAERVPNGVDILVELDVDAAPYSGFPSTLDQYTLFGSTGLGVDAWIKSSTGTIVQYPAMTEIPIDIRFQDNVVVMRVPSSVVDLSRARLAIGVGNWVERTDIAPNTGYLALRPPVVYESDSKRPAPAGQTPDP